MVMRLSAAGAAAGAAATGAAAGVAAGAGAAAYTCAGALLTVILSSFCLMVTLPSLSSILISPILLLFTTLMRS
jgi:hypothetical protein